MEIHRRPDPAQGVALLALDGGLDHSNTSDFVARMDELLEKGASRVVLDLGRLTYASSWGVSALVRVHHHYAARGGRIAFANLHSALASLLALSRLDRLFDLYATVADAVAEIAPNSGVSGKD